MLVQNLLAIRNATDIASADVFDDDRLQPRIASRIVAGLGQTVFGHRVDSIISSHSANRLCSVFNPRNNNPATAASLLPISFATSAKHRPCRWCSTIASR